MIENLQIVGKISLLTYVVSSMLVMGMSQRLGDVLATLKQPRMVAIALAVNFIAAPLAAFLLTRMIPLEPAHAIGLLLMASAAGSPFIPKLAEVAGADLACSVAIMVLLMVGSIVFLPAVLPFISPGLSTSRLSIAMPLILLMLLPLTIGFVLSARWKRISERAQPLLRKTSQFAFLLLIVLLVGLHIQSLIDTLGSFAIGSYMLFVGAVVVLSYVVGGRNPGSRDVFVLASGQRNISAALVVAVENFKDPTVAVMVLVGAVVGLSLMLGTARLLRTRKAKMN